jgi:hypothetical protein
MLDSCLACAGASYWRHRQRFDHKSTAGAEVEPDYRVPGVVRTAGGPLAWYTLDSSR